MNTQLAIDSVFRHIKKCRGAAGIDSIAKWEGVSIEFIENMNKQGLVYFIQHGGSGASKYVLIGNRPNIID